MSSRVVDSELIVALNMLPCSIPYSLNVDECTLLTFRCTILYNKKTHIGNLKLIRYHILHSLENNFELQSVIFTIIIVRKLTTYFFARMRKTPLNKALLSHYTAYKLSVNLNYLLFFIRNYVRRNAVFTSNNKFSDNLFLVILMSETSINPINKGFSRRTLKFVYIMI